LDNNGERSADRIVPEWQNLEEGQHLHRAPKGPTNWWTVVVLEPNRTLVLQTSYKSLTGQSYDPRSGPMPRAYTDGIWGFHLQSAPSGRTRLATRTRNWSRPRLLARPFGLLLGEPVHFVSRGIGDTAATCVMTCGPDLQGVRFGGRIAVVDDPANTP
jgi:hypothetical protein